MTSFGSLFMKSTCISFSVWNVRSSRPYKKFLFGICFWPLWRLLNHRHQESVQLIKWQVANVRLLLINNLRKWILNRFFSFCFFFSKTFETASIERKKKHKINFLKLGFFSFEWHRLTFLNRCEWFSLYFHTFESIQTFRFFYNILFWKRFYIEKAVSASTTARLPR